MVRKGPIHFERHPGAAGAPLSPPYVRRQPERTVLYQVVKDHLATFLADARDRSEHGMGLPRFVAREFEQYLACGLLCHGFARVRCHDCGDELLVSFSCKNRGCCPSCTARRMSDTAAHLVDRVLPQAPYRQWVLSLPWQLRFRLARDATLLGRVLDIFLRAVFAWQRRRARAEGVKGTCGSVTWIQRFGGFLNLNVHFHALLPDGVFARSADGGHHFHPIAPPEDDDVAAIARRIYRRIAKLLAQRTGTDDDEACTDALAEVQAAAVQTTLLLEGDREAEARPGKRRCAQVDGLSLHANTSVATHDRLALERLCRYAGRPPLALSRLAWAEGGKVAYRLKRPGKNGARALLLTPIELLRRISALIPPPRRHAIRYHGIFAPHAARRPDLLPSAPRLTTDEACAIPPPRVPASVLARRLDWAALLERVFALDVLRCTACGGQRQVIAFLSEPSVVTRILRHLDLPTVPPPRAPARAPPQAQLSDGADEPDVASLPDS